jgi:REP-associated tyrosine transposase
MIMIASRKTSNAQRSTPNAAMPQRGLLLSANGALIISAWGEAPGYFESKNRSAESAIHLQLLFSDYVQMSQSLSKVIIHIIFSTKDREGWLDGDVRPRMHGYIATICRDLHAEALRVGGVADHIHLVTTLPRIVSQPEMIEAIKTTSSKWIKGFNAKYRGFYWQRGYGVFSTSPTHIDDLLDYVSRQEEHHRSRTFQDEYRDFLRRYNIEFDERYVWD